MALGIEGEDNQPYSRVPNMFALVGRVQLSNTDDTPPGDSRSPSLHPDFYHVFCLYSEMPLRSSPLVGSNVIPFSFLHRVVVSLV